MIWRRLKNLWELSAYRVDTSHEEGYSKKKFDLKKDVSTIEKKLAKIIDLPKTNYFDDTSSQ